MHTRRLLFTLLFLCAFLPGLSHGGQYPTPSVEFSGVMHMETMGMKMDANMYMTRDKQRTEMVSALMGGMKVVMIIRQDRKVAWNLMPDQKMYSEVNLEETKKQTGDFKSCDFNATGSTPDVVNGMAAKKSHASVKCEEVSYEGDFWTTAEGITVKMDMTGKAKDGSPVTYKAEMSDLKIGRQDPSLFEIPAGYNSMGNMDKMMKDFEAQGQKLEKEAEAQAKKNEEEQKRRDAKEAAEAKQRPKVQEEAGRSYTGTKREEPAQEAIPTDPKKAVKSGLKKLLKW